MDADYLRQLGFDLSTGYVFRNNKTWGSFNAQGITMYPEGLELIERLEAGDDPAAPPVKVDPQEAPAPKPTKPAAKRAAKAAAAPAAEPTDNLSDALAGLGDLLNQAD